jgi:glutaredoxin
MNMTAKRIIEVYSAGCPVCNDAVKMIKSIACSSCEVFVLDMKDANIAEKAKSLGIRSVPAVVIDGKPADCCAGRGPDQTILRTAGLGKPLSK